MLFEKLEWVREGFHRAIRREKIDQRHGDGVAVAWWCCVA